MLAPICLFTYNRLFETKLTIEALRKNKLAIDSDLYIFSDGPKTQKQLAEVNNVRNYISEIDGFKSVTIIKSKINKGLANSIIEGVSEIVEKYGKVIVLEDDLITSANFLIFMNKALDFYENEKQVQTVNGFAPFVTNPTSSDVYFQVRPFPWGWGTWKNRWDKQLFDKKLLKEKIDANPDLLKKFKKACGNDIVKMFLYSITGRNNSWYVRWTFSHFERGGYAVFPCFSFVENIGYGEDGTHCKAINSYSFKRVNEKQDSFNFKPLQIPDKNSAKKFLNYFSDKHKLLFRVKMLGSVTGRKLVFSELKMRLSG